MPRPRFFMALLGFALTAAGCASEGPQAGASDCDAMLATFAACDPNLLVEAECTEESLAMYGSLGGQDATCDDLSGAGKADWFAFGGCDSGQHVCHGLFCCDDYVITRWPGDGDFDIVAPIDAYQAAIPTDIAADIAATSLAELQAIASWTWEQDVAQSPDAPAIPMAVEYTAGVTDVPFDAFVALLPAQDWGVELDHYLGGERQILDTDAQGRAVSQIERMVLSALPCDFEDALLNQDMTKAERILYGDDAITVYWRVYYSDNGTTAADVGSVSFLRHDAGTRVVFHSAHSLRAFHVPLPNAVAMASLGPFFRDHVAHYFELVAAAR